MPESVQLFLDGQWVDITEDTRDGVGSFKGRQDESARTSPGEMRFLIEDPAGRYNPANPRSDLYGLIRLNTPVRWMYDGDTRWMGELSALPQRWDTAHADVRVAATGGGIFRRLAASDPVSALYTYISRIERDHNGAGLPPVAWWPLEEGELSTYGASAIGGENMLALRSLSAPQLPGTASWGQDTGLAGTRRAPTLSDGRRLWGNVPLRVELSWVYAFAMRTHSDDGTAPARRMSILHCADTSGSHFFRMTAPSPTVPLQVAWGHPSAGNITILEHDFGGDEEFFDDVWHFYVITAQQFGTDAFFGLWVDGQQVDDDARASLTVPGIRAVELLSPWTAGTMSAAHPVVFIDPINISGLADAAFGHLGERAGFRARRLCQEAGLPFGSIGGGLHLTAEMGPQTARPLLDLLHECAEADQAILLEPRQIVDEIGGFERGTLDGWVPGGSVPPTLELSDEHASFGNYSAKITWGAGGTLPLIQRDPAPATFVPGRNYTLSAWVWVPTGSPALLAVQAGGTIGPASTLNDEWERIEVTFEATSEIQGMQIWPAVEPAGGEESWVDQIQITTDQAGVGFRGRWHLYNQNPILELDYSALDIADLEPEPDDLGVTNDVQASRPGGGTVRRTKETGSRSVAEIGRYGEPVSPNLYTDACLPAFAEWLLHLGTWDETRYPQLTLDLIRHPELAGAAQFIGEGDRIRIVHLPEFLPPGPVELMVQHVEERASEGVHDITFTCTPADAWNVFQIGHAEFGRFVSTTSTLQNAVDTEETTLNIRPDIGKTQWIESSQRPADFPFDIVINGERMAVTAIGAPVLSVQEFTVIRGVAGFSKNHAGSSPVRLYRPGVLAR